MPACINCRLETREFAFTVCFSNFVHSLLAHDWMCKVGWIFFLFVYERISFRPLLHTCRVIITMMIMVSTRPNFVDAHERKELFASCFSDQRKGSLFSRITSVTRWSFLPCIWENFSKIHFLQKELQKLFIIDYWMMGLTIKIGFWE